MLYRFDALVVKVADTKTVADSLWQGYNVSRISCCRMPQIPLAQCQMRLNGGKEVGCVP